MTTDHVIDAPPPATDLSQILPWYSGKGLERVRGALASLAASEQAGAWLPKASRSVRAALVDQRVAVKFACENERRDRRLRDTSGDAGLLDDVSDTRDQGDHAARVRGWTVVHAMMFGQFWQAPEIVQVVDDLAPHARNDAERRALATARRWASDFTPVAHLVAQLDATRPRPHYVIGEISPTVHANVQVAMGLRFETVRTPEIRWDRVQLEEKGELYWGWVGTILWPEGTRHGSSKFSVSASGSDQCQACGHAIRDNGNWWPLVLDGPEGPASLWVGRDCARKLFGCKVGGDGTFSRRPAP